MGQDDNVHFLRPKKRETDRTVEEAEAEGLSTVRTNFDDGILSTSQNVVPIDPKRAEADQIFETRQYEGEDLRMGQVLRRVRETLGLDLSGISKTSLIRENFLMAIERMEINTIPKGYLTVYLRTFAQALGLPPEAVIRDYTAECGAVDEVKTAAPVPKVGELGPEKPKWPLLASVAAIVALIGLSGIGLAQWLRKDPIAKPVTTSSGNVNGARESLFEKSTTRPLPEGVALELIAKREAWIEVRAADGTIFRSRVMAEGESYFPRSDAGWTLSAEDGGAFVWRLGTFEAGALGADGAQVFSLSVDRELARVADLAALAAAAAAAATPDDPAKAASPQ